ncbi:hypothetical protein LPJ55_002136 [Coemansia sp. RSA 990]|nr:hypothetical protein BX667DRAFT_500748 [Coemansia mojavensis]KAJ1740152.1 hypothetical protein LPJ68_004025 [Coemansia sp. RSA 1086]KAJ1748580.1 hypothetical protein LPJ79_004420 [Coemansia sp. RSA 1821]KAJ1873685.1 hypothetical protein LPJ55_002136 [Coemansia sp. RSA 990]KAJ2671407.1 hypothetical protein IWW42_003366 [Coemansia sp. RSA 1085]
MSASKEQEPASSASPPAQATASQEHAAGPKAIIAAATNPGNSKAPPQPTAAATASQDTGLLETAVSSANSPESKHETDPHKTAERDRELVEEFEYLLEKSQQLFSGLSDLPEIGSKYWQPHFQRTFEVYTKLWKFQNQHRLLLEKPEHYGLKRWEVGEIASKIGQLYYRYYLRTSETNYLQEAFVFYDAIRERNYFKGEQEVRNSALMIKKLRYYARFIVVCLQMNNTLMMLQLLEEVKSLIDVYSTTFNPVDKMEWSLVVKEMALFMQAVCSPVPVDEGGLTLPVSYRLVPRRRARMDRDVSRFRLQEAVVVGNRPTQIKFSELTLDMYHVLQMLEREPSVHTASVATTPATEAMSANTEPPPITATTTTDSSVFGEGAKSPEISESASSAIMAQEKPANLEGNNAGSNPDTAKSDIVVSEPKEKPRDKAEGSNERDMDRAVRRPNPHKYVLYQPSVSQIQVYLANAFREVGEQGCVLLYLSSDGQYANATDETSKTIAAQNGYIGGVSTMRRATSEANQDRGVEQLIHTLHPADLVPFTRKALFLIVESECSMAYRNIPNLFNQPLLCLLSPTTYPVQTNTGNIYTFFLHSPIVAFCVIAQITTMSAGKWTQLHRMFDEFEDAVWDVLLAQVSDAGVRKFMSDDFLRQILIRHVLCCVVLELHVEFTRAEHLPQSSPDHFQEAIKVPSLKLKARDIIEFCAVTDIFRANDSSPPEPQQHPADVISTAL